jgi:nucleotide-binding universal stress UspA family protein
MTNASVSTVPQSAPQGVAERVVAPVSLGRILVALDASDHANRSLTEALRLAATAGGIITGIHAYAAKLHDRRFRQMEGGLPARYLKEEEMMRQRNVHDDLISRGLAIISDSYHDTAETACRDAGRPYRRLSPEGKNYARIVEAAASGDFNLLVMGSLGLGAMPGAVVGSVCERVARRCPIDLLVVKDPAREIGDGPLVVGLDGSEMSYGALRTALDIGRRLDIPVHAVAAYDPYYHYVAFERIARGLSKEAGQVFRFKEQERLHEELIDNGLAKIYQSHLDMARSIAAAEKAELTCVLLDGKPYRAVLEYVKKVGASLLLVGRTGVHADSALDIGSNAENLLRCAPCHVWLARAEFAPDSETIAERTIVWSAEAEAMLSRAPEFARGMARKAVVRFALERGHTFISSDLVAEVANRLMPGRGEAKEPEPPLAWAPAATALIGELAAATMAGNVRARAEKKARRENANCVRPEHVRAFLGDAGGPLEWTAEASDRLARVPEMVRDRVRDRIETLAHERGATRVDMEVIEAGMQLCRHAMHREMLAGGHKRVTGPDEGEP